MLKLRLVFCFALVYSATVYAQNTDSTYIDVTIEGLPAGKTKLVGSFGDQNYLADSTVIDAKGHFVLRRKKPLFPGYYTFLLPGSRYLPFLVDLDQKFTLRAKVSDIFGTAEVSGDLNPVLFFENMKFQASQEEELATLADQMSKSATNTENYKTAKARQTELLAQRKAQLEATFKKYPNAFFTKFKIAGQNPDWVEFKKPNGDTDTLRQLGHYRGHFFDGVDFTDERLLYTPVIVNKLRRYIKDLTPQRPDSIIVVADALVRKVIPYKEYFKFFANWIALNYENGKTTVMDGEAVYVHIVQNFFKPELAFWDTPANLEKLQKHVWEMEASLLGKKGPDVRAQDQYGVFHSIYEKTAPIIVIFMFSPDCEHCQKESPEVQALYEKWKDKGVDFYGIAVNTNDADWKAFIEKNKFTFTNVFDPTNRAIYAKYFVDITPELYVLNQDRTIIAKNLHPNQLETIFEREFRKMKH
ncbi:MAG: TlpA family protein disulfide reductase [Bacteroidetes bacterium]|nr:TlpA family protein disulfide reductase [Bacteroidota bacterium]